MNKQILILCFSIFISNTSFIHSASAAEETLKPIEVTATRTTAKQENKTSAVTIITQEEIQQKQHMQVKDILREQLGISVVSQGPLGTQTSIFMRGANSSSTLVMIDGVQVNLNTTGGFDFANLQMDNIERIEILRGPQSTLWGADAVGGVINIVTKRGKGDPTHSVAFEAGSFETFKETLTSSGALGKFDYSLSASRTDSDGFSAFNEERGATEDDGYRNTTLSTRLGHNFGTDGRIEFIGRYSDAKNDFDDFATDSALNTSKNETFYLALPIQKSISDWWDTKLNLSFSYDKLDTIQPSFANSKIYSRTYTLDFQNNVTLSDYFSTIFGFENQVTNGRSTRQPPAPSSFGLTNHSQGLYIQGQTNYKELIYVTAGIRYDNNSEYKDRLTQKYEIAVPIKNWGTKIRAGYATGFRAPTVSNLLGFGGNPNLKPEESENWEVGITQKFFDDRIVMEITYFNTNYTNLIEFPPPFPFTGKNIGKARSEGVETSSKFQLLDDLDLTLLHTWNQATDEILNQRLLRRPLNTASVTLHHIWKKKLDSLITVQYRSSLDRSPNKVGGRTLVRAALSYQLSKNIKLTARGENLFDKEYEEPILKGTAGISGYGGFIYTFN